MSDMEARQWRRIQLNTEASPVVDSVVVVALTVPPLQRCVLLN